MPGELERFNNVHGKVNGSPQLTWVNIIATLALLLTVTGGAWVLFQNQFANLEQQFRQTTADLNGQIKENRSEIERQRDHSVLREEHSEFVKRLDSELSAIQKRLDIIEATRPTTGELQSAAGSIRDQVGEIKERLRFLEQVPVLKSPIQPSTPIQR